MAFLGVGCSIDLELKISASKKNERVHGTMAGLYCRAALAKLEEDAATSIDDGCWLGDRKKTGLASDLTLRWG